MRRKTSNRPQFYLKESNSTKETKLRVIWFAGYEDKPISYHTSIYVLPKNWSHNEQKVSNKDTYAFQKNRQISEIIDKMITALYDIETQYRDNKSIITNLKIRYRFLDLYSGKKNSTKQKTFWEAFNEFILRSKQRMKPDTLKVLNTVKNHLSDYEKATNDFLSFDKIDIKFYDKFQSFLFHEREHKLSPNTVSRTVKVLKTFLKESFKYGICPPFDLSFLKSYTVPSYKIALSEEELDKLWMLDVIEYEKYFKVRNLFLLQCYTGMRISDLMRLTKENIKESIIKKGSKKVKQIFIEYVQEKTGEKVSVPAIKCVPDILAFYPGYNLPKISEQRYNDYIKEVCKMASIVEDEKITYYEGNVRKSKVVPKYELVTSHTGRRTFVTLSLERGMKAEAVMKFSGHKSLTEFFKYVKLTPEAINREFLDKWSK